MNERIRELARQSGIKMAHDETLALGYLDTSHKKFAELIIQECITQAKSVGDLRGATDDMIYGADIAALQISKHFGVES